MILEIRIVVILVQKRLDDTGGERMWDEVGKKQLESRNDWRKHSVETSDGIKNSIMEQMKHNESINRDELALVVKSPGAGAQHIVNWIFISK